MKFTEGAFKDWGYELAREEFGGELIDGGPWLKIKNPNTGKEIVVKDVIADAFLQRIAAPGGIRRDRLYEPERRLHLRRHGGPGWRHRYRTGRQHRLRLRAVRSDSRHRAEVRRRDKVNPGSIILSAEMMLRHMGWFEAADLIVKGMEGAIAAKTVTYDFERLMEGAKLLKCSEFGDAIVKHM